MAVETGASAPAEPDCLPPRRARPPGSFTIPAGGWDTHAHVVGGGREHPFVSTRGYTPPTAGVDDYVAMLDAVGLDYGVVIAISVHGSDNRLIAEALRRYPSRLRGVVSIDGSESEEALQALRALGVCGVRLNEHFAGGSGTDRLQAVAERCRALDWHLDLGLSGARLAALAPVLADLPVVKVIDHMGFCPAEQGVEHAHFRAVLDLVRRPDCWVKLSGGYRLTSQLGVCDDTAPFVRALWDAAPTRTIWAADWPNVAVSDAERMPETGEQLDTLSRHLGDPRRLYAVLVDNPLRLYGRPGEAVQAP